MSAEQYFQSLVSQVYRGLVERSFNSALNIGEDSSRKHSDVPPLERTIVEELIREALDNGLAYDEVVLEPDGEMRRPSSGSAARLVAFTRRLVSFAVKVDDGPKLVREARTLRAMKGNHDLPASLREALPTVYAIKDDRPPYGYLFQFFRGYENLADLIFNAGSTRYPCERALGRAMDLLFGAYQATAGALDFPLRPDPSKLFLERIRERVAAARRDPEFDQLARQPLRFHNVQVPSLAECLDRLEAGWELFAPRVAAPFATFTHGDPHPENILVRITPAEVTIRLIDPKEWGWGDYVFDVAKLTHYLKFTGPAEKWTTPLRASLTKNGAVTEVTFSGGGPSYAEQLATDVLERAAGFASATTPLDTNWRERYQLAFAANLLGLPATRLEKGLREAATVYLMAGTRALADFLDGPQSQGAV